MTETFVHVDRSGELEPGDVLDLDWSVQLMDESAVTARSEAVFRDLYPEGLSRHGVRYASTMVGADQNVTTPGKSEPLVAFLDTVDPETESVFSKPTDAIYEWFMELVRLAEALAELSETTIELAKRRPDPRPRVRTSGLRK